MVSDSIEKTIAVINQMTENGVIESYALGDATAVIFYTEPIATEDVDVFVHAPVGENPFTEFQPVFDYLKDKGYRIKGEHFYVEGFPVQFLPTGKKLIDEAVRQAREFELEGGTIVRVMNPEHLVAARHRTAQRLPANRRFSATRRCKHGRAAAHLKRTRFSPKMERQHQQI